MPSPAIAASASVRAGPLSPGSSTRRWAMYQCTPPTRDSASTTKHSTTRTRSGPGRSAVADMTAESCTRMGFYPFLARSWTRSLRWTGPGALQFATAPADSGRNANPTEGLMRSIRRFLAAFAVAALVAAPAAAVTNERVDRVDSAYAHPMVDVLVI